MNSTGTSLACLSKLCRSIDPRALPRGLAEPSIALLPHCRVDSRADSGSVLCAVEADPYKVVTLRPEEFERLTAAPAPQHAQQEDIAPAVEGSLASMPSAPTETAAVGAAPPPAAFTDNDYRSSVEMETGAPPPPAAPEVPQTLAQSRPPAPQLPEVTAAAVVQPPPVLRRTLPPAAPVSAHDEAQHAQPGREAAVTRPASDAAAVAVAPHEEQLCIAMDVDSDS